MYNDRKELTKANYILTKIKVLTEKRKYMGRFPVITWEEMGLPFQSYFIGDLRTRGMVAFCDGGFYLKEAYQGLTREELINIRDKKQ